MTNKMYVLVIVCIFSTGLSLAQTDSFIIATLNKYCGGTITKQEILENPEIVLNSNSSHLQIEKIGFFSNTSENLLELWAKGGKLNFQMISRIQSLVPGDMIYFDIYVNNADSSYLIHPLEFEISNKQIKKCPCFVSALAIIKGTTHGTLTKKELLQEGKLTINSDNTNIKLLNYKVASVIQGYKKEVVCYNTGFNSEVKHLINSSMKYQSIYFSDIQVSENSKCYYLNAIEIYLIE